MASGRLQQQQLINAAMPRLKALNREFRETVTLAMLFENHIEVVATIESPHLIRMGNTVGRILPPHASSLGKAITAFQPEERCESLLRSYGLHRFTGHTITDEVELKQELERIRQTGRSLDAEESALEGSCFGAPIRGANHAVIAAISLSMPKMRLRSDAERNRVIAAIDARRRRDQRRAPPVAKAPAPNEPSSSEPLNVASLRALLRCGLPVVKMERISNIASAVGRS